jgi:hypothetical protein
MNSNLSLASGMSTFWISVVLMLLAGCSSPEFVNPPSADYLAPAPSTISGTWKNVEENGERVRISGQKDGTLKLYFSSVAPSSEHHPAAPLLAQSMHFDNSDWILIDFRKLAAWQGEEPYTEKSPYRLLKYVLETPDRLCGIELDTNVFAEAIKSGQLEGKVFTPPPHIPQPKNVTVTSPGELWVKWWIALPESQKKFGPKWCFVRAK